MHVGGARVRGNTDVQSRVCGSLLVDPESLLFRDAVLVLMQTLAPEDGGGC